MEIDDLINSINKLSNELNDQENLRKQLTGDIAHELRTPLTSIKGHLDAIIVGIWEPTNERLNSINEEVKRITNLVDEYGNNAIYIKVFKKNNSINISIKDSGIGIPKSEYKNIFERFYRLDKSRGANEKGAGVGLTIAKSIVNAHGGEIEVYSEINKGSEFIISLPS